MAKTDNKSKPSSSGSSTSNTKTDSGSSTSDTKTDSGSTETDSKGSKTSSGSSYIRGERQKVVTDSYRNSWDHIFEKKKKH